ncbi:hypothetical protein TNCV_1134051 [Trichonephila clavipes]|nr:hypothetical protein TNCV_1134051 [Trichonephila clavipes]
MMFRIWFLTPIVTAGFGIGTGVVIFPHGVVFRALQCICYEICFKHVSQKNETRERSPALDGEKEKALPWIERTREESPVWNGLRESHGWRKLEEGAKEIGVERKETR